MNDPLKTWGEGAYPNLYFCGLNGPTTTCQSCLPSRLRAVAWTFACLLVKAPTALVAQQSGVDASVTVQGWQDDRTARTYQTDAGLSEVTWHDRGAVLPPNGLRTRADRLDGVPRK